ncbi:MAG TPA: POTRA domain-containing protein [Pyrinomonadaceae bacterium]|nr:hypothetical protein [Chloracidobacterium sp.]MBK7802937.1 hypothetical protein [Chloracidobacterium sp.]MBK9438411.1 hypothetical protein [Chloracidobacterium sp.]MBL0240704.1 hypothetical protein [Chloracidobacterium sp.]HQY68594.1 POTRA domain-containing protein [Pyrinomonadaceae bacterium]
MKRLYDELGFGRTVDQSIQLAHPCITDTVVYLTELNYRNLVKVSGYLKTSLFAITLLLLAASLYAQVNKPTSITSTPIPFSKSQDFIDHKTKIAEVTFPGIDYDYLNPEDSDDRPVHITDLLKYLRDNRCLIEAGQLFDAESVGNALKATKQFLSERGYIAANVVVLGEKLQGEQMKLIFSIEKGFPSQISRIVFRGLKYFTNEELADVLITCLGDGWRTYDKRKIEYCTMKYVREAMFSKGFAQLKIKSISRRYAGDSFEVLIDVDEGIRYTFGEITVEGATVFKEKEILELLGYSTGDIFNGKALQDFIYEKLADKYTEKGYVQYSSEFEPKFVQPPIKGMDPSINIRILIDEGRLFKFDRVEFARLSKEDADNLIKKFPLKVGDVFNEHLVRAWFTKLNESGDYKPINVDFDIEIREDEEEAKIFIYAKIAKSDK